MANYAPKPHMLRSIVNQGMPWWSALAELIDNSFDAGATRAIVKCGRQFVEVSDDGNGISDMARAVTLGDHQRYSTTKLGRYGIGLKEAWLFAGDRVELVSVKDGIKSKLVLDLNDFGDSWDGPDPTTEPTSEPSGTTVKLCLRKGRNLPGKDAKSQLSWVFTPAIEDGKQVVFIEEKVPKKKPLIACRLPVFIDSVRESFDVNGKRVDIHIGIIADGDRIEKGPFWIQHEHRNICSSSIGAKGFTLSRVGGVIHLGSGWKLTKNKDDLSDNREELDEEIHSRIKFLLQKAEQLSMDVQASALRTELESMVNEAIGEARREARSAASRSTGTVVQKNTDRKRRNAAAVHENLSGSVNRTNGRRRTGFSLAFGADESDRLGNYDSLANTVTLNLDHPFVRHTKDVANIHALYAVAIAILSEAICNSDNRGNKTLFEVEDFGMTFGMIIKTVRCEDARKDAV